MLSGDLKNVVKSVMVCCLVSENSGCPGGEHGSSGCPGGEHGSYHRNDRGKVLEINSTGRLTIFFLLLSKYLKKKFFFKKIKKKRFFFKTANRRKEVCCGQ